MKPARLAVALLPAGLALAAGAQSAQQDELQRPNILLILCDDMGFSDIGCYGGEIFTPNLDRLAAEGIRFTQFYNTARSCPSRASLMTGRRFRGDAYQGYLNDRCVKIAEVLGAAGYTTNIAGKWHMGTEPEAWPYHRGFQNVYAIHNWVDSYYRVLEGCEAPRP